MRSLVTGGAGFIGAHVARHLLANGHDVVVLDDLSTGFAANLPDDALFVEGSVVDAELTEALFREHRFEHVFHLAAYAAENMSHFVRRFNYTNNLVGSVNVLNASLRSEAVRRFVFTSSIAVYGEGQVPMTEALIPRPEDPYGIGKYAFELDLAAAQRLFGLDYVVFRPHNVYGELQSLSDPYRNVIGIFMNQLMHGNPLTIFGNGSQTRSFSYIDDVAPVIARSVDVDEAANEVFNIGGDTPYTVLSLAEAVARAFGVDEPEIVHMEARNEVVHAVADHSKLRRVFGDFTPVALEEGLHRMADWARAQPASSLQTFDEVEVLRGLPSAWAHGVRQGI